jgi:hypothetical protein
MSWRCLVLLWLAVGLAAADPYDTWAQGRPAEAVAPLLAEAHDSDRWDAWLDAGLAAAAADQRGPALAFLARAHHLAPERAEPRDAMRSLGASLPTTWCERAGPIGLPGTGWSGVALCALAGLLLGGCWLLRRGRVLAAVAGCGLLIVTAPGLAAMWLDSGQERLFAVRDTQALDSTGSPLQAIAEGTMLLRSGDEAWAQRVLVRLPDGSQAWVAQADLTPPGSAGFRLPGQ